LEELDRKLKLELYLAEKYKDKSDAEYMQIQKDYGIWHGQ
jgi:hypothetical protein